MGNLLCCPGLLTEIFQCTFQHNPVHLHSSHVEQYMFSDLGLKFDGLKKELMYCLMTNRVCDSFQHFQDENVLYT